MSADDRVAKLIRARTGEGRKRAKERGVRFGRPRKMTPHQRQEVLRRLAGGETQADVARSTTLMPPRSEVQRSHGRSLPIVGLLRSRSETWHRLLLSIASITRAMNAPTFLAYLKQCLVPSTRRLLPGRETASPSE
jgi:hypothetical protein